jgi:hypothetical protein
LYFNRPALQSLGEGYLYVPVGFFPDTNTLKPTPNSGNIPRQLGPSRPSELPPLQAGAWLGQLDRGGRDATCMPGKAAPA